MSTGDKGKSSLGAVRRQLGAERADAVLGALVMSVLAMMVVPLPTVLLDLLIATNLAVSCLLLLVSLSVRDGLAMSAMPTLLLITTLYRLALNVSSTRLILLQADAGRVIGAFGETVVRGDYVVGAVVFLILTLIQYVVVARGAERVAEVGARFSLDAMPGKQMAIDADLRAGALGIEAASQKRAQLERESQLYGAMDGAMKFVKGDAIAGIVITAINFIAGSAIGVFSRGLDVQDSLRIYGLLTIGDGLVSQIPSLLVATSAGIAVTRVSSRDGSDGTGRGDSLGTQVSHQLFGDARVLWTAAGLFLLLAIVPGLPALPFGVLALLLGATAYGARGRIGDERAAPVRASREGPVLCVELGTGPFAESQAAATALERAQVTVSERLGLPLAPIAERTQRELPASHFRLLLEGVPIRSGELSGASVQAQAEALEREVTQAIRSHARELLGVQATQALLDTVALDSPALVQQLVPRVLSLPKLTELLQRLVGEQIPVRPLRPILEALHAELASEAGRARAPRVLCERIRARLSRHVTHAVAQGLALVAHPLDPAIEDAVRDAIRGSGDEAYLAIEPGLARDIIASVRACLRGPGFEAAGVLLTQPDVRPYLRELIEHELPNVPVLSYAELAADARVEMREPVRAFADTTAA